MELWFEVGGWAIIVLVCLYALGVFFMQETSSLLDEEEER